MLHWQLLFSTQRRYTHPTCHLHLGLGAATASRGLNNPFPHGEPLRFLTVVWSYHRQWNGSQRVHVHQVHEHHHKNLAQLRGRLHRVGTNEVWPFHARHYGRCHHSDLNAGPEML